MFTRGIAACLSLTVAAVAQAGVVVNLLPDNSGPYVGGETVTVEVYMSQSPTGSDHRLRLVQFDFSDSHPDLGISLPLTHDLGLPGGVDIFFWEFLLAGQVVCDDVHAATCGKGHFVEDDVEGQRSGLISIAYYGDLSDINNPDLGENTDLQVPLLGDGSWRKIGTLRVTLPTASGDYLLDILNADDAADDNGAQVHWGFGQNINQEDITVWRANAGQMTGGTIVFDVGDGPPPELESSVPACDFSLTRTQDNCVRLTFSDNIPDPVLPGEVEIRELLAGGGFGADLSASFTFTVEGGNVLKIAENGSVLSNETWYGVLNTGSWSGVAPFEVDYRVIYGDVDNNGTTTGLDASDIWGNRGPASDCSPYDIDGNGTIGGLDASDAWGYRNSTDPGKPSGHACSP